MNLMPVFWLIGPSVVHNFLKERKLHSILLYKQLFFNMSHEARLRELLDQCFAQRIRQSILGSIWLEKRILAIELSVFYVDA